MYSEEGVRMMLLHQKWVMGMMFHLANHHLAVVKGSLINNKNNKTLGKILTDNKSLHKIPIDSKTILAYKCLLWILPPPVNLSSN